MEKKNVNKMTKIADSIEFVDPLAVAIPDFEEVRKVCEEKLEAIYGKLPWEGKYNYNAGNNKTWLEIMEYANVPQWYIDSLCKAYYLTPRAHVAYDTKLALTMAWFKVHYLEAFYRAVAREEM